MENYSDLDMNLKARMGLQEEGTFRRVMKIEPITYIYFKLVMKI